LEQFVHCKEFPITKRVLILFVTAAINQNLSGTSLSGPVSPRKVVAACFVKEQVFWSLAILKCSDEKIDSGAIPNSLKVSAFLS